MLWFNENKEQKRFYLLPGMGGKAYRRKQKLILKSVLIAGLVVSVVLAVVLYWINRLPK